jgi:predicted ribonuclease YlaK
MMEHLKQHLNLWYLNRSNGYVQKALGGPITDYENSDVTGKVDKLFGAASQHVSMDSEKVFAGIMPIIQQMMQQMQQFKPQAPMTPEAKVLMDTSMAETQRRTAKDQADVQLAQQKHDDEMRLASEDAQKDMAIAQLNNSTKETIESAKLTRETIKSQTPQPSAANFNQGI